jgi:methionine synthase II (cobalamin-independent)
MQRSTDRILTTHAGSLARPADLLAMVRAREAGQPYDHAAFAARVRTAVAEKDEEAFLLAVAEVMREEYHAIVQAGFLLQIDSPDLAMGWHAQFPDKTLEEFRTIITRRVEALKPRPGWHPARARAAPHLLGERRTAASQGRRTPTHH